MKFTSITWTLLFVIAFFTAGFFPALILGALAVASSVSTGLHVQAVESRGGWAKELGR